jgi:phage major head subunit gpT-like protein
MIITPQALRGIYTAFNTVFNKAFEGQHPTYEKGRDRRAQHQRIETCAWLGDIPGMREWIGEREIQNLSGSAYTIKNKDFELTVGVDRNAVEDDKIGLYNPSIQMLGESAALHPDELVYGLLANGFTEKCYDGKAFFATDHPVGKDKASNKGTAKLSMDAYKTARTSMMSLKNSKGRPLALVPDLLVVPPALEADARDILVADFINGTKNTMQGTAEIHVEPRLASDSAWFLLCTKRPVKPLIYQQRKKAKFVSKTKRDRRQRLHEQEVHLRRRLSRQRGLRLLADGLRL